MKKVLIIGASGFLGKNIAETFKKNNIFLIYTPARSELNLLDPDACKKYLSKLKPDYIIHAAIDIESIANSLKIFFNILSCYDDYGHLIQLGSGGEYDRRFCGPLVSENFFGKSIPIDDYGISKYAIANQLESFYKGKVTNFRLFGVYGKYEDTSRRFISNNICRVLAGDSILVNKDMYFDYVYVEDFTNYLVDIIDFLPLSSISYNFCTGKPISLVEIAEKIKLQFSGDRKLDIKIISRSHDEYSGSPMKLFSEFREPTLTSIDEGIKRLFAFYENNKKLHTRLV
jgi:GDP-L-fucose synthase